MPTRGTKANYGETTLVASAARTTSSDSGEYTGFGPTTSLRAQLEVTAVTGTTPTLDVLIEDTLDSTTWNSIGTFTQAITTTRQVITITTPYADRIRVRWTIGGTDTPTFTFSVVAVSQGFG